MLAVLVALMVLAVLSFAVVAVVAVAKGVRAEAAVVRASDGHRRDR
jgi:hypothetical protein